MAPAPRRRLVGAVTLVPPLVPPCPPPSNERGWHGGAAASPDWADGPGPGTWYGARDVWRIPLQRDARRQYGDELTLEWQARRLTYRHRGLYVAGVGEVPAEVVFHADPPYLTYGLGAQDYPRVFADPGAQSPHRMPDDGALCLYYPLAPPLRRWRSVDGLLVLLDLVRDHLFFEEHWRATGGFDGGEWLGKEAPHGIPGRRAA